MSTSYADRVLIGSDSFCANLNILYVRACPTHPTAVSLVRDILASQGITAQIVEVLVADEAAARELQFRGSPTIRVNDKDVVEESNVLEGGSLCCRVYSGSIRIGLPPVDAVRRAIVQAREVERQVKQALSLD